MMYHTQHGSRQAHEPTPSASSLFSLFVVFSLILVYTLRTESEGSNESYKKLMGSIVNRKSQTFQNSRPEI